MVPSTDPPEEAAKTKLLRKSPNPRARTPWVRIKAANDFFPPRGRFIFLGTMESPFRYGLPSLGPSMTWITLGRFGLQQALRQRGCQPGRNKTKLFEAVLGAPRAAKEGTLAPRLWRRRHSSPKTGEKRKNDLSHRWNASCNVSWERLSIPSRWKNGS